ncbi:TolA protein [Rhodovulum sp. P5]|uniref:hypothetical protein n=1 Tax=Rhodovulum sp. P5 TaxID=1564506 RepID=UPI0009C27805|nr:hypothetical protein [Rhodovulum sp. P5]ARE39799.1 TolA protein [Rhodovulum sp. P5]
MNTGTYISGGMHLLLIAWVLLAGLFAAPPPKPMQVTDVTILSGEEFAALMAPAAAPRAEQAVDLPQAPEEPTATRPVPAPEVRPERPTLPERQTPVDPDIAPDTSGLVPLPEAEVAETVPPPLPPEMAEAPEAPLPDTAPPRPAERIAPEPARLPDDVAIADLPTPSVRPDPAAVVPRSPEEAAAPEDATTEIVTEAEERPQTGRALASSPRPRSRPARPAVAEPPVETPPDEPAEPGLPVETAETAPEPTPEPEPETDTLAAAVADAVAAALAAPDVPRPGAGVASEGPVLTAGERDALRIAVSRCWNVGALSSEALATTVVLGVDMQEDGHPLTETIRLVSWTGGPEAAARQTYASARRAIILCGARGFPLPPEKFDQWREIEMTFNPENMRVR